MNIESEILDYINCNENTGAYFLPRSLGLESLFNETNLERPQSGKRPRLLQLFLYLD